MTKAKVRTLFTTAGCSHCRPTLIPVGEVNNKLPFGKKINILDCYTWENYHIATNPLMHKIPKFNAYPHLHIDNINVKKMLSANQFRAFLDGFNKKDLIIDDGEKWMIQKE